MRSAVPGAIVRSANRRAFLAVVALVCGVLAHAEHSGAATYYVRGDGGSAAQCTGLADAPYSGKGVAQACAWKHPYIALPPTSSSHPVASRIHGGDTLLIGRGSYMMGYGAPETDTCFSGGAYDCHIQPPPGGLDKEHPTRILGQGHDQGCTAPPELWGTEAAHVVLALNGTKQRELAHVEVGCLELTDHSSCVINHCIGDKCSGGPRQIDRCPDKYPFGPFAALGIYAADATDINLHDVNIHGMAGEGVSAGRLTDWTVSNLRIWANGFAGWDGDISNGGVDPTSNRGTIRFSKLEIAWSGCGERYPDKEIFGCWGQEENGYGDGFSTGKTAGDWVFEDSHIHHNTQDGLDLLYVDGSGSVTVRRMRAEGNAGNQLKISGNATISDSVVDGNCASFRGVGNMQEGDQCRADGGAIHFKLMDGKRSVVENTRVTGEGGCLIVGSGGGKDAVMVLRDNTLTGSPRWDDKGQLACGYYLHESKGRVEVERNTIRNVKTSSRLQGVCAQQADGSLLGAACEKLKKLYRSLRGSTSVHAIAGG